MVATATSPSCWTSSSLLVAEHNPAGGAAILDVLRLVEFVAAGIDIDEVGMEQSGHVVRRAAQQGIGLGRQHGPDFLGDHLAMLAH
jgi:hypothetical protein